MNHKNRIARIVLVLASLLLFGFLQTGTAAFLNVDWVDLTGYPEVQIHLNAWDGDSIPLEDLAAKDFKIQEDSGSVMPPTSVEVNNDAPLRVVLVLDVSASMQGEPLSDAQAAAVRFIDRLSAKDQAALFAFSDTVNPDPQTLDPKREIGFTNEYDRIYDLIDSLEVSGGTHLYNAVEKAVAQFDGMPEGHRAVLVLTDGRNDPAFVGDPDAPILFAQEINVPVFVVGLGNDIDVDYLQRLAGETGGQYRNVPQSSELAQMFNKMSVLLKTTYTLTYQSQLEADGEPHTVTVMLDYQGEEFADAIVTNPFPFEEAVEEEPVEEEVVTQPVEEPTEEVLSPAVEAQVSEESEPEEEPAAGLDTGWLIAGAAALFLALLWVLIRIRRGKGQEVCTRCGYDVTGTAGPCPECGESRRKRT